MNELQAYLAFEVRYGMDERGWGIGDLAKASGVSPAHVNYMLTGQRQGSLRVWWALLEATGRGDLFRASSVSPS